MGRKKVKESFEEITGTKWPSNSDEVMRKLANLLIDKILEDQKYGKLRFEFKRDKVESEVSDGIIK